MNPELLVTSGYSDFIMFLLVLGIAVTGGLAASALYGYIQQKKHLANYPKK